MRLLQSLSRGLAALDYMRSVDGLVRLTDLAKFLDVEKPVASYILKTLLAAGYVYQDESRRYCLTDKAGRHKIKPALEDIIATRERYRPALEELVRETKECAHLAVNVAERVWYIDKIDSELPLKVDHPIGTLSPLHCTALGKAFLAFGNVPIPDKLKCYTPSTVTSTEKLKREIVLARTRGYAIDKEEYCCGVCCIARPIFAPSGEMVAALGVSGPSVRVNDKRLHWFGEVSGRVLAHHITEEADCDAQAG